MNPAEQQTHGHPLKILVVAASPRTRAALGSSSELVQMLLAIRAGTHGRSFEIVPCLDAQPNELRKALRRERPNIVHFIGHGTRSGELVFQDAHSNEKLVSGAALAQLLDLFKDRIRLVVLNACYSSRLAEEIVRVIDCAVGMTDAIRDDAAIDFATALYESLASGDSVQRAFELGRNAPLLNDRACEHAPELHVRTGDDGNPIDASQVVLAPATPATAVAPAPEVRRGAPSHRIIALGVGALLAGGAMLTLWHMVLQTPRDPAPDERGAPSAAPPVSASTAPAPIAITVPTVGPADVESAPPSTRPPPPAPSGPSIAKSTGSAPIRSAPAAPTTTASGAAALSFATSGTAACTGQRCTLQLGGRSLPEGVTRVCLTPARVSPTSPATRPPAACKAAARAARVTTRWRPSGSSTQSGGGHANELPADSADLACQLGPARRRRTAGETPALHSTLNTLPEDP